MKVNNKEHVLAFIKTIIHEYNEEVMMLFHELIYQ